MQKKRDALAACAARTELKHQVWAWCERARPATYTSVRNWLESDAIMSRDLILQCWDRQFGDDTKGA